MMRTIPPKYAGQPVIDWARRNGLDAATIPLAGFEVDERDDGTVWIRYRQMVLDQPTGWFTRQVDSPPPVNPEWARLFGAPRGGRV